MTVTAARARSNSDVCFVGIGAPSAACNVARLTHAPDITLIYESGTIRDGSHRSASLHRRRRPLRDVGDDGLGPRDVSLLAPGRPHHDWLPRAARFDKFGNINTTVIGGYEKPKTRLAAERRRSQARAAKSTSPWLSRTAA